MSHVSSLLTFASAHMELWHALEEIRPYRLLHFDFPISWKIGSMEWSAEAWKVQPGVLGSLTGLDALFK
jgi:hypothetical protein